MGSKATTVRIALGNPEGIPAVHIFHVKGAPSDRVVGLIDQRAPLLVIRDPDEWRAIALRPLVLYPSGGETVKRLRFAARMRGTAVILPAAEAWLSGEISAQLASGRNVFLFIPYPNCEADL